MFEKATNTAFSVAIVALQDPRQLVFFTWIVEDYAVACAIVCHPLSFLAEVLITSFRNGKTMPNTITEMFQPCWCFWTSDKGPLG